MPVELLELEKIETELAKQTRSLQEEREVKLQEACEAGRSTYGFDNPSLFELNKAIGGFNSTRTFMWTQIFHGLLGRRELYTDLNAVFAAAQASATHFISLDNKEESYFITQSPQAYRVQKEEEAKYSLCSGCEQRVLRTDLKKCGKCRVTRYCSRECQLGDWKKHKRYCRKFREHGALSSGSGSIDFRSLGSELGML